MLRFRRYRIFLVFAVFTLAALYHFASVRDWEQPSGASVEGLKKLGHKDSTITTSEAVAVTPLDSQKIADTRTSLQAPESIKAALSPLITSPTQGQTLPQEQTAEEEVLADTTSAAAAVSTDYVQPQSAITTTSVTGDQKAQSTPVVTEDVLTQGGQGRLEVAPLISGKPKIHWSRLPEQFPVPSKSIIPIPTGKVKAIPKIQYEFRDESPSARFDRERKLASIKDVFEHSWAGYKKYAWLEDELSPMSGKARNPFCGWAATLVDSLDTLWIMGMEQEFETATQAVGQIDFTTSIRSDIPLFETTIRYLGGLVSAYDLSGSKYTVLLDKAVELAEVLMGAFDTPNRMPITFYHWSPIFASQTHRAGTHVVLAELGSLSVEFTRLAQITKEAKYYDAIARISNEFKLWQNNTRIPGLWPKSVDASGCKKPDVKLTTPLEQPLLSDAGSVGAHVPNGHVSGAGEKSLEGAVGPGSTDQTSNSLEAPTDEMDGASYGRTEIKDWDGPANTDEAGKVIAREGAVWHPTVPKESDLSKRQLVMDSMTGNVSKVMSNPSLAPVQSATPDCVFQGLNSPSKMAIEDFTLGGMADSVYEYLPKEYMLLGGLREEYRTMYEKAIDATNKYLLFRPMIPDSNRDILVIGSASVSGSLGSPMDLKLRAEQQHLLCFAGGMYAIGAKIFDRKADMDIAAKLTDGCVWAYESTPTGIMPEGFMLMPCESRDQCEWNETRWYNELDPGRSSREQTHLEQEQAILKSSKETTAGQVAAKIPQIEHASLVPSTSEGPKEQESPNPTDTPLAKRQLEAIENKPPGGGFIKPANEIPGTPTNASPVHYSSDLNPKTENMVEYIKATNTQDQALNESIVPAYTPPPIPTHEEFVQYRLKNERLPIGVPSIMSRKYILRPEAIESVFIMYRITGDEIWREKGWKMFNAIHNSTQAEFGNTAIFDVTNDTPTGMDEMESFWLAETLKYFYLLFSDPTLISLDDYVLNTEAHPFKRPK